MQIPLCLAAVGGRNPGSSRCLSFRVLGGACRRRRLRPRLAEFRLRLVGVLHHGLKGSQGLLCHRIVGVQSRP